MEKYLDKKYDAFYVGTGLYSDLTGLTVSDVDGLLCDCEYKSGNMWLPIVIPKGMCKLRFFNIIYTLYLHNYIIAYSGSLHRKENNELEGKNELLEEILSSNFLKNIEFKKGKKDGGNRNQSI